MAMQSNEMTEHAEANSGVYKPSEHDGKKEDGTPDQRMKSDHGKLTLVGRKGNGANRMRNDRK